MQKPLLQRAPQHRRQSCQRGTYDMWLFRTCTRQPFVLHAFCCKLRSMGSYTSLAAISARRALFEPHSLCSYVCTLSNGGRCLKDSRFFFLSVTIGNRTLGLAAQLVHLLDALTSVPESVCVAVFLLLLILVGYLVFCLSLLCLSPTVVFAALLLFGICRWRPSTPGFNKPSKE